MWGSSNVVVDDSVPSWSSHALTSSNRDKVEFVNVLVSDCAVNDCSWQWVLEASWSTSEDSGVYSLASVDVHQLCGVSNALLSESLLDLGDLSSADTFNLSFTNTISVEDYLSRISAVGSLEGFTGILHTNAKSVGSFLTYVILDYTSRPVRGS